MKDSEETPFLPKKPKISLQRRGVVKILNRVLLLDCAARKQLDCGQLVNLKWNASQFDVALGQDDFLRIDKGCEMLKGANTLLAPFALRN